MRATRIFLRACLLAFGRALCRFTSTLQVPRAGPLRTSSNRRCVTWSPVDLGTDQQFDLRRVLAPLPEQVNEVGFTVQGAQHARIRQLRGRLRTVVQTFNPAIRLALLARFRCVALRLAGRLLVGRLRGVEACPQHAQRHPLGVDRQRRVQVQPARHGAGLVAADRRQPLRLAAPREVHQGAVLDTQHHLVRAHPAQRPLPMRLQYVLHRHRAIRGLVDQPIVAFHQCAYSLGGAGDGAQRSLRQQPRARHQPRAQAGIA